MKEFQTWDEFEKELNMTPEQEEEIRLEMEIVQATINARKNKNLTQEELSKLTGLKQSTIARVEKSKHSPTTNTLIRMLYPMGYTLKVMPLKKKRNEKNK